MQHASQILHTTGIFKNEISHFYDNTGVLLAKKVQLMHNNDVQLKELLNEKMISDIFIWWGFISFNEK